MLRQIVIDRSLKVIDAGIAAAPDTPRCDLGKKPFDQVQPSGAGGREMQLEAHVLLKPGLHLRRLVGGIVVQDHMDIAPRWHSLFDTAKEFEEFLGPISRI